MATASELPINTAASAMDMAEAMFGNGIQIETASYTGADSASGIYSDANTVIPDVAPADSGVILSTGKATDFTNSSGDANTSSGKTTNHGLSGDADLNAIAGAQTYDAAIFEATFTPEGSVLSMQVTFSSEEYLEYVNSGFNDAVGIFVNGVKAELTVGTGDITINNINDETNSNLYRDNPASEDNYNTEMDGLTVVLNLKAPVNPDTINTIKIAIADGGDGAYDSNLMIAANSVQTELIAVDDAVTIQGGTTEDLDVLANDGSVAGPTLTITKINGVDVVAGDSVTLATGEVITLNDDGTLKIEATDTEGPSSFSYTITDSAGNTDAAFVNVTTTAPCFVNGARIRTPRGLVPVEHLATGDAVWSKDHGFQPVRWIGTSTRVSKGTDARVEVDANALGYSHNRLCISQQHRLLLKSMAAELLFGEAQVLIKAKHLVGRPGIRQLSDGKPVRYIHLMFDRHDVIEAEGVHAESFHPGQQTMQSFDASCRDEIRQLFPHVDQATGRGFGPTAHTTLLRHEAATLLGLAA